jgi:hypothetical protein
MIAIDTSSRVAFCSGESGEDHDVTLVSRDVDFRHFAAARGLKLLG